MVIRGQRESAVREAVFELRRLRVRAPISRRKAARFLSTAVRESSLVKPRFRSPLPYVREEPPSRVENPCSSHGSWLRWRARRIVSFVLFGARVGTHPCYLKAHMWSGHSCPLLLLLLLLLVPD